MTTPLLPLIGANDGPIVTVKTLTNEPKVIPRRILRLLDNQFIIDDILRNGGNDVDSMSVVYEESTPLFADVETGDKTEFGEYKIAQTSRGQVKVAVMMPKGLSLIVSEWMRKFNQMDELNKSVTQITNTIIRTFDKMFRDAVLLNTNVPTMPASATWNNTATNIGADIQGAKFVVFNQDIGQQTDDFAGFEPDTIVMSAAKAEDVLGNTSINQPYEGIAQVEDKPAFKGVLPRTIKGLVPFISRTWPNDKVLVCQRKVIGAVVNQRGLRTTPLYPDQKTETYRCDTSRWSTVVIDQPLAGVLITGVDV